jgi:hypothetical protein
MVIQQIAQKQAEAKLLEQRSQQITLRNTDYMHKLKLIL